MSRRERLMRMIEQLSDDEVVEVERVVAAMSPDGKEQQAVTTFEEALAYTHSAFEKTFRKLAQ